MTLENGRISDVFEGENTEHRKSILLLMTAKHLRNWIGSFYWYSIVNVETLMVDF